LSIFVVPAGAFVLAALILSVTLGRAEKEIALRSILLTILLPSLLTGLLAWFAYRFVSGTVFGGEPTLHHLINGFDQEAQAQTAPPWAGPAYFFAMILGMFSHTLWEILPAGRTRKPPNFDKWLFVRPALGSPDFVAP
jgi:hypothetical protein